MKKYIGKSIAAIAAALLLLSSCDVLDITPQDRYSVETVWSTTESADQYLIGLYAFFKENCEILSDNNCITRFNDAYSDLIKSNSWNQYNHTYNMAFLQGEGSFNGQSAGCFECWDECYIRIKRINEFIRDANLYGGNLGETYASTRIGEARFIRAFVYFKLMKVYGKCVIRDAVDGPAENDKAMASADEVWQFIIDDLTYAGENIDETFSNTYNRGRATRAAAWALLTRVGLFAERWDVVVDAAQKCIGAASQDENGNSSIGLSDSYEEIFSDPSNRENLFCVEFIMNKMNTNHRSDVFFRPVGDGATHGGVKVYGVFNPTSEYVDSFEMADGTPFSWSDHGDDPYSGREPRFYASILYNGAPWEGRTIETFEGGADGILPFDISGATGSTVTGYYLKKFIEEDQKDWEKNGSDHFAIIIRYAEVLLNKAEALAQQGHIDEAMKIINDEIRARVGLPSKSASNLDEFMEVLRHEKIVELGGEGLRFWDLRRWKLACSTDSGDSVIDGRNFHGCKITKNNDGTFSYEQIVVDGDDLVHFFPERYYAFAIPQTEISNNGLVTSADQNPGW